MTRSKRVKHEQISTERKRNAVFRKRVESLTKKANDLSILCGVDIGIVIHKSAENNAVLWPSPEIFGERLRKFLDFSDMERAKKMVIHEKYLDERLNNESEDMLRSHNKNDLIEPQLLINELIMQGKNFYKDDVIQLNGLQFFTAEMLKKLENRDNELNNEQELQHLPLLPRPPPLPPKNPSASLSCCHTHLD